MEISNPQNQSAIEHFNFAHLGIVVFCSVLLLGMSWLKNPELFAWLGSAAQAPGLYTYEQAQKEVFAQMSDYDRQTLAQTVNGENSQMSGELAMIDPNFSGGSVLGASTGTNDTIIPEAKQVLTEEVLNLIPVNFSVSSSPENAKKYKDDLDFAENQNGASAVLEDVNSQDKKVLTDASKKLELLLQDLMQISVPADLVEYHKVKLLYYSELKQLAEGYAGLEGARDPQDVGFELLPLKDYFSTASDELYKKYGLRF